MAENISIKELIAGLFRVILIIAIIYVAFQVLKAILGGTWATENIMIAGIGIILAGMFVIVGFLINQSKCLGTLEERTRNIGNSLFSLGKDFKEHISEPKK